MSLRLGKIPVIFMLFLLTECPSVIGLCRKVVKSVKLCQTIISEQSL
jgi:hypothetical protein